jgi:Rrf2 family protein
MNSEYTIAVHSMVYLASLPERMANSEMIAENVCTHSARIRKVMGMLRRSGYIRTKEGIGGGFQLDCQPEEINLGELYRIVCFGSLKPGWCSGNPETDCAVASNISEVMDVIYYDVEQQLAKHLSKWTIRDVHLRVKEIQGAK